MIKTLLIILLVLIIMYLSMGLRIRRIQSMRQQKRSYEEISSPLGQAIKDFVAIAGGVYLGLMALAEFLKVTVPITTELWGLAFDPIAVLAVTLAIITPLFPSRGSSW